MARKASSARKTTGRPRKAAAKRTTASRAKRAAPRRQAEPRTEQAAPVSGQRTYRARQTVMGPAGRVRAGELLQLDPSSGLARSAFVVLVEDETPPDAVTRAFGTAE